LLESYSLSVSGGQCSRPVPSCPSSEFQEHVTCGQNVPRS
jgi:hypothetical protein